MSNLAPEELERLINAEFGDDVSDDDDAELDFPADDDDIDYDDPSDEEVESLTASDDDYGQSIRLIVPEQ